MNFIEALLLAFALCVDTLVVSTTTAFRDMRSAGGTSKVSPTGTSLVGKARGPWHRGLLLATILAFFQFAFPLLGALIGDVARSFIEAVDHWVAFGLLALIGGKMILDGVKQEEEKKEVSSSRYLLLNYSMLGIATSIDGLAVGIGLGLDMSMNSVLGVVTVIGIVTFLVALLGIFLGKRNIPVPERTATVIAGVVLIGLGVKILIEHLCC